MKRFPGIEIGIGFASIVLIWILGYPQYEALQEKNKRYAVMVNMYTIKAAVENYAAYNEGIFPKNLKEIEIYLENHTYPLNPYTNIPMKCDTVLIYEDRDELKKVSPESKNGRIKGKPGNFAYGYVLEKENVIAYGILGFDEEGRTIREKDPAGNVTIVVLTEND